MLLGKNVVGGALSIITAAPKFENSGQVLLSYGNYNALTISGHATGGLTEDVAGRLAFQARKRDGFARDVLHQRDVEDLESFQARGSLLWEPGDSGWSIRGIADYTKDSTNGINVVAVDGGTASCETSYLRTNCTRPWSNVRRYVGLTDPRQNAAQSIQYKGEPRIQQFMDRDGYGLTLDIEKDFKYFTFNSLTGYRTVDSAQLYDQTGIGPEVLDWSVPGWLAYVGYVNALYGTRPATSNNGQFLFAQPVGEAVEADQFSQEFRFTSNNADSRFDWIAGAYYKSDTIDKTDRFIGENFLGAVIPGGNNPLSTLSGENRWVNNGENDQLRRVRPDRLQVHRRPEAQRRRALYVRREGRQRERPGRGDRRPLQPERPAGERHDRGPVPGSRRHDHPDAHRRHRGGHLRRAQPVDLRRGHGLRDAVLGEVVARRRRRPSSNGRSTKASSCTRRTPRASRAAATTTRRRTSRRRSRRSILRKRPTTRSA